MTALPRPHRYQRLTPRIDVARPIASVWPGAGWQAGQESNLQPADLEAAALPIELPAYTVPNHTIQGGRLQDPQVDVAVALCGQG
jgi:hypothetical protein